VLGTTLALTSARRPTLDAPTPSSNGTRNPDRLQNGSKPVAMASKPR